MSNWQGGGRRGPAPRTVQSEEHALHPAIEACVLMENAAFKHLKYPGDNISTNVMQVHNNGKMFSLLDARAALAKRTCTGIHPDHNNYPVVKRFNHRYPAIDHYVQWNLPVVWEHDTSYRYIPGYSRYVINFQGDVKNAYNGKAVRSPNGYTVEIVPEGPKNDLKKVSLMSLRQLAWSKLPEDFISFGFGSFSHEISIDKETGAISWLPRIPVVTKQGDNVEKWTSLSEFMQCCVEDFQDRSSLGESRWKGLRGQTMNVAGYMLKGDGEYLAPNENDIQVNADSAPESSSEAPQSDSVAETGANSDDVEFAF